MPIIEKKLYLKYIIEVMQTTLSLLCREQLVAVKISRLYIFRSNFQLIYILHYSNEYIHPQYSMHGDLSAVFVTILAVTLHGKAL